jgi:predicted RNase H-like HicB family nuclease
MHNEFTAIIEKEEEWSIAYCPEIPRANGQGKSHDECREYRNIARPLRCNLANILHFQL